MHHRCRERFFACSSPANAVGKTYRPRQWLVTEEVVPAKQRAEPWPVVELWRSTSEGVIAAAGSLEPGIA